MGQTADELRQEIDQKRDNASQKIDQIEQLVTGAADQVKDQVSQAKEQVTQAKEQIKQTFDWRHQVEEKPLVALGAAFIGGIVLGGITGGGDDRGSHQHHYYGQQPQGNGSSQHTVNYGQAAATGGVVAAVRGAAKKAGLDDTIANMADGLMATFSDRIKQIADDAFPGLADKLGGTSSDSAASGSGMPSVGSSSRTPSTTGAAKSDFDQSGAYGSTHASTGGASFS